MRLLFGPDANGTLRVTDADTGAVLPCDTALIQSDDTGQVWLWMGTTRFSAQITTTPAPTHTPTPTPVPPAAKS